MREANGHEGQNVTIKTYMPTLSLSGLLMSVSLSRM